MPTVDGISSRDHADIEERKVLGRQLISFIGGGRGEGVGPVIKKVIGFFSQWRTNL